jgi:hypothetical protein
MKKVLPFFMLLSIYVQAQVSISTPASSADPSAILDVKSNAKGVMIPRMKEADKLAIPNPATSLMIYQTDVTPGYYYNSGTPSSPNWTSLSGGTQSNFKTPISSLPFTITQPGSYILTKNLSGVNGIVIQASNVSIDLNFFTLSGSSSTTSGISSSAGNNDINIYNGNITNWFGSGINADLASQVKLFNIVSTLNGDDGMSVGNSSLIINCISRDNGLDGISTKLNAVIQSCVTSGNGGNGVSVTTNATIMNSSSASNTLNGYNSTSNAVFESCTANLNNSNGFKTVSGSTYSSCSSSNNSQAGFDIGDYSSVQNCHADRNSNYGIYALGSNVIKNNELTRNKTGVHLDGTGNDVDNNNASRNDIGYSIGVAFINNMLIRNKASQSITTNYSIPANNGAPIIGMAGLSALTLNNPLSNISL